MIEELKHSLLFSCRQSVLYHHYRHWFFKIIGLLIHTLSIAFYLFIGWRVLNHANESDLIFMATLTLIFPALNLVIQPFIKSQKHFMLAQQFISLEESILNRSKPSLVNRYHQ